MMTQIERDDLKEWAEYRKANSPIARTALSVLAESQRMRDLLENAAHAMKHPSKNGRHVTLQLAALIESFLAEHP